VRLGQRRRSPLLPAPALAAQFWSPVAQQDYVHCLSSSSTSADCILKSVVTVEVVTMVGVILSLAHIAIRVEAAPKVHNPRCEAGHCGRGRFCVELCVLC
jgi:hypothetical protein